MIYTSISLGSLANGGGNNGSSSGGSLSTSGGAVPRYEPVRRAAPEALSTIKKVETKVEAKKEPFAYI